MSSQIARKVVQAFREPVPTENDTEKLSVREQEVLALLAKGNFFTKQLPPNSTLLMTQCIIITAVFMRSSACAHAVRQWPSIFKTQTVLLPFRTEMTPVVQAIETLSQNSLEIRPVCRNY